MHSGTDDIVHEESYVRLKKTFKCNFFHYYACFFFFSLGCLFFIPFHLSLVSFEIFFRWYGSMAVYYTLSSCNACWGYIAPPPSPPPTALPPLYSLPPFAILHMIVFLLPPSHPSLLVLSVCICFALQYQHRTTRHSRYNMDRISLALFFSICFSFDLPLTLVNFLLWCESLNWRFGHWQCWKVNLRILGTKVKVHIDFGKGTVH